MKKSWKQRNNLSGTSTTFSQSHSVADKIVLFYFFKLKLILVCRESNSVSSHRKVRIMCYFSDRIFSREKMSQNFCPTRYISTTFSCLLQTSVPINNAVFFDILDTWIKSIVPIKLLLPLRSYVEMCGTGTKNLKLHRDWTGTGTRNWNFAGTSAKVFKFYRDLDRDQNSKLYDIFNWVAFQVNFFVHHKSTYYFHTNVGFFLKS